MIQREPLRRPRLVVPDQNASQDHDGRKKNNDISDKLILHSSASANTKKGKSGASQITQWTGWRATIRSSVDLNIAENP